jgi:hypothetical protein
VDTQVKICTKCQCTAKESIEAICLELAQWVEEGYRIRLLLHTIARGNLKLLTTREQQLSLDDLQQTIHAYGHQHF